MQMFLKNTLEELKSKNFVQRLWEKDASLWKEDPAHQKTIKNSLGWLTVPKWMKERLPEVEEFAYQIKKEGFKHILLLGMGGSSLAPEMFRTSMPTKKSFPKLHILDSTNPDWIAATEKSIEISKTLFIFASKSGTTIEPLSFFRYFYKKSGEQGNRFVAITDAGTFLEQLAKERNFRKVFLNPSDIGGRFSALSYFGIVPAALAGMDVQKIVDSAIQMMNECKTDAPLEKNPGILLGAFLASMAKSGRDKVILLLSQKIRNFGLWIEQLIAESSGKEGKGIVPVSGEEIFQSVPTSEDRCFVLINFPAHFLQTAPSFSIRLKQPEDLGGEFFRWEFATATACSILGVNAFDQPDVQSAKDKTESVLKNLSHHVIARERSDRSNLAGTNQIATLPPVACHDESWEKDLRSFLAQAQKGDYIGLLAFLPNKKNIEKELINLRKEIGKITGRPVVFGYGPRYLHSTGQLFKGGPNTGLFILLTCPSEKNFPVPESNFSFRQLHHAQAVGDYQALKERGRKVLWIELKSPAEKSLPLLLSPFARGRPKRR